MGISAMWAPFDIAPEAMGGDGTIANVGIRTSGCHHCQECNQQFDTERALQLHVKFTHGAKVFRVITINKHDAGIVGTTLAGEQAFRIGEPSAQATDFREQVAAALKSHVVFISLLQAGSELLDGSAVHDYASVIVKQDTGRNAQKARGVEELSDGSGECTSVVGEEVDRGSRGAKLLLPGLDDEGVIHSDNVDVLDALGLECLVVLDVARNLAAAWRRECAWHSNKHNLAGDATEVQRSVLGVRLLQASVVALEHIANLEGGGGVLDRVDKSHCVSLYFV